MFSSREERKREDILDRALALFLERGISSQSMEAIAAGIGVSKATLYKYFPQKELLGMAAIERRFVLLGEQLDAIEARTGISYPEHFRDFFSTLIRSIGPIFPVLMRDITSEARWLWPKIQSLRAERVFPRLTRLIQAGRNFGYVRDDLDDRVAATLLIAIIERVGQPDFLINLPIPPAEAIQVVIRMLTGGILSDEGRRLFDAIHLDFENRRGDHDAT